MNSPSCTVSVPKAPSGDLDIDIPIEVTGQLPLPQRPRRATYFGVGLAPMMLSAFLNMGLCWMVIIMIYQYTTQHAAWSSRLSTASLFLIVTHSYTLLGAPYMPFVLSFIPIGVNMLGLDIPPLIVGLVYVGIKVAETEMTALDKAVMGLLISCHVPQIIIYTVVRWVVNVRVYNAWLETYEPNWSPAITDPVLTAVLGIIKAITRALQKANRGNKRHPARDSAPSHTHNK